MEFFISIPRRWAVVFLFILTAVHGAAAGPGESTKPLEERMEYARQTEKSARASEDSSQLAEAFYLWGKAYSIAGDYVTSQRYYLQSLRIQESLKDSSMIARLYVRLSENERGQQHFDQAMRYARKGLEIATRTGLEQRMQIANMAVGKLYEVLWESDAKKNEALFDSAHHYYRTVELLIKAESSLPGTADTDRFLGILFSKKGDARAFAYLEKALKFFEKENMYSEVVGIRVYLGLAHLRAGRPQAAFNMLSSAKEIYYRTDLKEVPALLILEEGFIEYYRKMSMPDSVIAHLEYLHGLKEAQFTADRTKVLEWLNAEYEMQQQEKELQTNREQLALQERNLGLQKTLILLLFGVAVSGVVAGGIFYRLNLRNRQVSERNARLVSEQNHRVKNHLQMVASLLDLQSYEIEDPAAREVIADSRLRVDAVALLQKLLFSAETGAEVSLPDYISQLTSLVLSVYNLAGIRKKIEVAEIRLSTDKALSFGLILTELLTNACKYAFAGHASPELTIRCCTNDGRLLFSVADNGPGLRPGQEKTSFGMQLIRIQAEQLYAVYGFQNIPEAGGLLFKMELTV